MSAAENGKVQEVYDPEKHLAVRDTWPDREGDFRNMYTHILYVEDCERMTNMYAHTNREKGKMGRAVATRQLSG